MTCPATPRWWSSIVALALCAACVAPSNEPPSNEPPTEASASPPVAPEPGGSTSAELTAEEVAAFGSIEEAIASYRGPRVFVVPSADRVEGGVPFVVSARLEDADGAHLAVDDAMTFTWTAPDGWEVEGEGPRVTVTPPAALPAGEDPLDVHVSVERDGARLVRGGVSLSR